MSIFWPKSLIVSVSLIATWSGRGTAVGDDAPGVQYQRLSPIYLQRRFIALCETQQGSRIERFFPQQIIHDEKFKSRYHEELTLKIKYPTTLAVMTRAW